MKFDLPKELASMIKVIGVGGGGSNAVNYMFAQGIEGVDFIICNTDRQSLDISPIPVKLQLGVALTEGLGAGSIPERGGAAAQESIEEIREVLGTNTKMLFVTAGMGGGTGTGAAPVIARVARDMGILTVGIVTMPFKWEGKRRKKQATEGVEELRESVDTLLVINNDRLRDLYGNLEVDQAFAHADNVLTTAAKGIAEIITKPGKVNVDFEDVRTVMSGSGVAIMGMGEAEGEERAIKAAQQALNSPLLNDNDIRGAKYVLLNITLGASNISMDEMSEVTDHIQEAAGSTADVIWGYCTDESLGDGIRITVIATGFEQNEIGADLERKEPEKKITSLDAKLPTMITAPIVSPVQMERPRMHAPEQPHMEPYLKPAQAEEPQEQHQPQAKGTTQTSLGFQTGNTPREDAPQHEAREETPEAEEKVVHNLIEEDQDHHHTGRFATEEEEPQQRSPAEHQARAEERVTQMRDINMKMRTPQGLNELEKEPAFKRRQVALEDGPKSTDSSISRYSLTETTDEEGRKNVELRHNNPFLHDNVD